MVGRRRLTDEERERRIRAAKAEYQKRNFAGQDRFFVRAGRDPVEHRKTTQLYSGAIRSPLSSPITTEDDIADLMREWRGDDA
jgi:hypothetical protein